MATKPRTTKTARAATPATDPATPPPDAALEQPAEPTCDRAGKMLRRPDGTIVIPIDVHGEFIRCVVLDRTDVLSPAEVDELDEL